MGVRRAQLQSKEEVLARTGFYLSIVKNMGKIHVSLIPSIPTAQLPSQPGCQTQFCHCPPSASTSDSLDDGGGQDNPALGADFGSGLSGAHLKDEEKSYLGAGSAPGGPQG